jgi:hypothetical protein
MKKEKSLSHFFELARKEAQQVPVGEIASLTASGKTSPLAAKAAFRPRRILRMFNPTKILIMTTFIVIITTLVLFFNPANREAMKDGEPRMEVIGQKTERLSDDKTDRSEGRAIISKITPNQSVRKENNHKGVQVLNPAPLLPPEAKDTVFKGIILDLSKEELTRLGFVFDDEGYYYLNQLQDGSMLNFWSWQAKPVTRKDKLGSNYYSLTVDQAGGSTGFASGIIVNKSNKSQVHDFDFYPVLTTNLNGEDLNPIKQIMGKIFTEFDSMNDTLVPVLFTYRKLGGLKSEDKLIWFKVSDRFFDLINSEQSGQARYIYNRAKAMNAGSLTANRVNYNFQLILQMNNAIRLTPEVLKCMGINYSATSIDIRVRAIEYWFNISLTVKNGETYMSGSTDPVRPIRNPADTLLPTTESIILLGTSNVGNMKIVDMPTRVYRQLNRKEMTFQQYLNLCIPVMVEGAIPDTHGNETIFWIYPNERFFNCLPPEIAVPMKKEFDFQSFAPMVIVEDMPIFRTSPVGKKGINQDSVSANPEPVPCVYFTNLCESLPGVDYVNLYPNPATDKLNVDLVLQSAKKIRFRVLDLGGRVITDDGAPENFTDGGQVKHQLDVSKLQNGLYLLLMTDEEGARLTRRFVKN